jgi:Macrocin-O-methyltransferase (TylF)
MMFPDRLVARVDTLPENPLMKSALKQAINKLAFLCGYEIRRVSDTTFGAAGNAAFLFPAKFRGSMVEAAIADLKTDHPNTEIVVLTDRHVQQGWDSATYVTCGEDSVEKLEGLGTENKIFLYACDSDSLGIPYLRSVVRRNGRFYPVQVYTPSSYANINDLARSLLEDEYVRQCREGFAKFDFGPGDFLNIIQAIDITRHLAGLYVELGCYRGSSSCVAVRYMSEAGLNRECYFLDVFDGFVYEAARSSSDMMWAGSHATEGLETVRRRISSSRKSAVGVTVQVVKCNVVEEPLPTAIDKVAVANVDVDLYEAVGAALFKIADKIVPGGVIIVEDPGHTPALIGSRLALLEFLESEAAEPFIPVYLESGQTFLFRR